MSRFQIIESPAFLSGPWFGQEMYSDCIQSPLQASSFPVSSWAWFSVLSALWLQEIKINRIAATEAFYGVLCVSGWLTWACNFRFISSRLPKQLTKANQLCNSYNGPHIIQVPQLLPLSSVFHRHWTIGTVHRHSEHRHSASVPHPNPPQVGVLVSMMLLHPPTARGLSSPCLPPAVGEWSSFLIQKVCFPGPLPYQLL